MSANPRHPKKSKKKRWSNPTPHKTRIYMYTNNEVPFELLCLITKTIASKGGGVMQDKRKGGGGKRGEKMRGGRPCMAICTKSSDLRVWGIAEIACV